MINLPSSGWPAHVPYHREMTASYEGTPCPWWTASSVKLFSRCPAAAFRRYMLDQPEPEKDKTADMRVGDAAHAAILQPQQGLEVVNATRKRRESKAKRQARQWGHLPPEKKAPVFAAFEGLLKQDGTPGDLYRRAEGAFWTLANIYPKALTRGYRPSAAFQQAYVQTDSLTYAQHLLTRPGARTEWTCIATDLDTGLPIKCRTDLITPGAEDSLIIGDLKVTEDAGARFHRKIRQFRYDLQAAHYRRVLRAWLRRPDLVVDWRWIALQSRAVHGRHPCVVYRCEPEQIDAADAELLGYLRGIAECLKTGQWTASLVPGESWTNGEPTA